MSSNKKDDGLSVITQLKHDRKALASVVEWIILKGYEKKYKKCRDCHKVGVATTYHGKVCRLCYRKFLRDNYAKHHPEAMRTRKVDKK